MNRLRLAVAVLAVQGGRLSAQSVAYDGSLSVSTGRYFFTERTTSIALNSGISIRAGRFTFRGTLPVWWQNTTLVTATGAGPVPGGGPYGRDVVRDSGEARQQRKGSGDGTGSGPGGSGGVGRSPPSFADVHGGGAVVASESDVPAPSQSLTGYEAVIADPTVQASVRLVSASRVTIGAGLAAKVPVADTTGVGTGEWDIGASTSVTVGLSSRVTLGLDGSYWYLGDLPAFDFRNPVTGSASLGALLGNRWGMLTSFSAGTSALEGYDAPMWVSAALSRFGARTIFGLNCSIGLSETVPDLGFGLLWTIRLGSIRM
jgi:hypothetical protein